MEIFACLIADVLAVLLEIILTLCPSLRPFVQSIANVVWLVLVSLSTVGTAVLLLQGLPEIGIPLTAIVLGTGMTSLYLYAQQLNPNVLPVQQNQIITRGENTMKSSTKVSLFSFVLAFLMVVVLFFTGSATQDMSDKYSTNNDGWLSTVSNEFSGRNSQERSKIKFMKQLNAGLLITISALLLVSMSSLVVSGVEKLGQKKPAKKRLPDYDDI